MASQYAGFVKAFAREEPPVQVVSLDEILREACSSPSHRKREPIYECVVGNGRTTLSPVTGLFVLPHIEMRCETSLQRQRQTSWA